MSEAEDKITIHELTRDHAHAAVYSRLDALDEAIRRLEGAVHSHEPEAEIEARIDEIEERIEEVEELASTATTEAVEAIPEVPEDVSEAAEEATEEVAPEPTHRLLRRVGNGR